MSEREKTRVIKLAKAVKERKSYLAKVIPPILDLAFKFGKEINRSVGSCNTHIKMTLKDFGGFTFITDTGQSMMGGNDVKVIFGGRIQIKVYWQAANFDAEECRVDHFSFVHCELAERLLKAVTTNKRRNISLLQKKRISGIRETRAEVARKQKLEMLENEASRLKVSV